jgi:SAM-dependent methyltransferase
MSRAGEFYDLMIAAEGPTVRGLSFVSRASQHLRFASFVAAVPVGIEDSVLDIGCGFADLAPFLAHCGHIGQYRGWEVSQLALDEARRRHPEIATRLELADATVDEAPVTDWIFCSGPFNVATSQAAAFDAMEGLFARARRGLVVTLQNAHGTVGAPPDDGFERTTYAPEAVYAWAKCHTPYVAIHDDYLPHDFLVAMLRHPAWELRSGRDLLRR